MSDPVGVVRLAQPAIDSEAIAAIYRPAVESSTVSFETDAPDAAEMARRVTLTLARTPWLVAEDEAGDVVGYAYAAPHRERAAYRWSVDLAAYVRVDRRGQGIGSRLYAALIPALRRQRYVNAYAGITLPNLASVRLHESIGMRLVGVYHGVGYKHGRWHDVAWYGLRITSPSDPPPEPLPLGGAVQAASG